MNVSEWYARSGGYLIARLWLTQDMRVALLGPSYVPDTDTHLSFADVSASEVVGAGYTAGGKSLTGKTIFYDAPHDEYLLRANDLQWGPGLSADVGWAVLYEDTADDFLWERIQLGPQPIEGVLKLDWALNVVGVTPGPPI